MVVRGSSPPGMRAGIVSALTSQQSVKTFTVRPVMFCVSGVRPGAYWFLLRGWGQWPIVDMSRGQRLIGRGPGVDSSPGPG